MVLAGACEAQVAQVKQHSFLQRCQTPSLGTAVQSWHGLLVPEGGFSQCPPPPAWGHTYRVQEGQHSQPLGLVFGFLKARVVSRVVVHNVQLSGERVFYQKAMSGFWVL